MTFKPAIWYPIAAVLSGLNVVAVWFAAGPGGSLHAMAHAAIGVAFGVWAVRLRHGSRGGQLEAGLEALEIEMGNLRQQLGDAQERLDFAERMLAQAPQERRADPERPNFQ